ncbi:hypothetical protein [Bacillus smithii]|uniref:hypothetical protein n=1 Tax=Bacillus smithii TaxID=1479 RepID=UPI003D24B778
MYLFLGEDVVTEHQIIAFDLRDIAYCLDTVRSFFSDVLNIRDSDDFENYFAWILDGNELGIAEYWQSVVSPKRIICKIPARDFISDIYDLYGIFQLGWFTHREYALKLEKIFFKHFGQAMQRGKKLVSAVSRA